VSEHKSYNKNRVEFVFRAPGGGRDRLHGELANVPEDLRGDIDWEVE
jgi:hypothetical protein